ncbi:hypothetical protein [Arenimonas sp.]|uniref:hypothetical protein n=1 Tax=Arenimonas sp. TaxID=1872635 RepID=UPI0039E3805A
MTHTRTRFASILIGFALTTAVFVGGAMAGPTKFGSRSLDIPDPSGFEPVSKDLPQVFDVSQAYLPPGNRLVEAYIKPEAKAELLAGNPQDLERYFQLQVLRQVDGVSISDEEFAANMEQVEAEIAKLAPTLDKQAAELASSGNKAVKDQYGADANLTLSGVQYDGVFKREPWGVFFSMGSNVAVGPGTEKRVIGGTAIVMVKQQLLYLYCFADDTGPEARRWVQENVVAWAESIREANGEDATATGSEAGATAGAGSRSSGVMRGAIVGALIGGIVGLMFWLNKKRKAG